MATLVCFHAHPDDEAITTGGLMAKASEAGHRVVLVTATKGEQGEEQPGVVQSGEVLWQRRVIELAESAEILGAEEPRFLGYEDSGMMDTDANNNPACFWQANVDEAAERLAKILTEVQADVVTIYDDHGMYGHPDHIQVHRVGLQAAKLAEIGHVYEATINREEAMEGMAKMRAEAEASGVGPEDLPDPDEFQDFGVKENDLAYRVEVHGQLHQKRSSLRAHASQVSEQSFFLHVPDEQFKQMFGQEWYAVPGQTDTGGPSEVELLPGLDVKV